jgi:hypothetical protein
MEARWNAQISTLRHEVVHAALSIYSCVCHKKCSQRPGYVIAATGHGPAWQNVYRNLKSSALDLRGKEFECADRHLGYDVESVRKRKRIVLSTDEVRRWTPKVNRLLGVTKYRIRGIWHMSLRRVAIAFRDTTGTNG